MDDWFSGHKKILGMYNVDSTVFPFKPILRVRGWKTCLHQTLPTKILPMGKKELKTIVRFNNVILTKVKVQSINDVAPLYRSPNKLRGDEIRLDDVYVFDVIHNEIMDTIFAME